MLENETFSSCAQLPISGLLCDAELVLTFREQSVGGATSSSPLFLFAGGPIGG